MPLNPSRPRPGGQRWLKLQAMAWLALGQDARAMQVFDTMLARQPDDAHALASRAHHLAQAGQRDAAITDLQALVAAHPQRSAVQAARPVSRSSCAATLGSKPRRWRMIFSASAPSWRLACRRASWYQP